MRAWAWVAVAVALSGCAAHHVPERIISTSWTTVLALAPGTNLGVALDDDEVRYGRLTEVDADALTIWERHGATRLARARVARVAVRTPTGTSHAPHVIQGALIGAVITGALAWLASAVEENPHDDGGKWALVATGTAAGAGLGGLRAPVERYRDQVIYIRP